MGFAVAAVGFSSLCAAQQAPGDGSQMAAENTDDALVAIVVTANKREESVNSVGMSITPLSGDELAARGIDTLEDLARAVPGMQFSPSVNGTPILTLRGVGFNESSIGVYPAVSVYVDEAPLPFAVLARHAAFDVERVEVLKGPQGTLFGLNSTGGAINYVAVKPTDQFDAGVEVGYGRFNRLEANAYISGPLAETVRSRFAITGVSADGWQESYTRPWDSNGKQSYTAARWLVDWDPAANVRVAFSLSGYYDTSEPAAGQFIMLQPQTPGDQQPQEMTAPFSPETPRAADWATGINAPRGRAQFLQPAVRLDIDLNDDLTLTSLSSYNDYDQNQTTDGDGSALIVTDIQEDTGYIRSFNQELRLANRGNGTLRWLVGANYENSETFERQLLVYPDNNSFNASKNFIFQNYQQGSQDIKSYAAFGNIEYDIVPDVTLKAGARYTKSENDAAQCGFDAGDGQIAGLFNFLGSLFNPVPGSFTPVNSVGYFDNNCFSLDASFAPSGEPTTTTLEEDNVSWRVGVDYRVDPSTMVYLNASRGFKAGSFPILAAATETQFAPVTQESVTAYEAGIKSTLLDNKAQLNAAVFYYDYEDKQVLTKEADQIFGILDVLKNIPKSRVTGVEVDFTYRPISEFTLSVPVTYLDTEITEYDGVDYVGTARSFAGSLLPFAPKWSYGLNADYRFEGRASFTPFAGISFIGRSGMDTVPGGSSIVATNSENTRVLPGLTYPFRTESYSTVDARLGFEAPDRNWSVMLWGKNLFNEYYWSNVVTSSDFTARWAGMPATYGITFSTSMR
jgi:iron complex outermembrane recepter protein